MISDDIIRQSAHKQMLEALPKPSRRVFPPTYYLYRAFKFVMLMTPCVSMQEGAREGLNGAAAASQNAPLRPRRGAVLTGDEPADEAAESDVGELIHPHANFHHRPDPCWRPPVLQPRRGAFRGRGFRGNLSCSP